MTDFFVLLNSGDYVLLNDDSSKILLNNDGTTAPKTSGAGPFRKRRQEVQDQIWIVFGQLLMEDNLRVISNLMREEIHEAKGYLKQHQITEIVGKLNQEQQIKLQSKLQRIDGYKIKEGNNPSYYKILLDILDEL